MVNKFIIMLENFIVNQDSFPTPIQLTFRQRTEIKTFAGGLVSILAKLVILTFLALKINGIHEKQASNESLLTISNVITKPNEFKLKRNDV